MNMANRFGLPQNKSLYVAWFCALIFAALQGHFFLSGYRLTGDETLFEYVIVHGNIAAYIGDTAAQQGRIGIFILLPMLMAGSHFAEYLVFRIFYVALWYADILLFCIWVARLARSNITLPIFVSIVATQSMIGYHMPPVGYPLQLGPAMLLMLGTRLIYLQSISTNNNSRNHILTFLKYPINIIYAIAALSSEYMMILGLVMVLVEVGADERVWVPQSLGSRLKLYQRDIATLGIVYAAYIIFRHSQPTHYDGADMNGLSHTGALIHTFFMHIASGTWLPFFDRSALGSRSHWLPPLLAAFLCGGALFFHGLATSKRPPREARSTLLLVALLTLGIVAITLPVVAAGKQQQWCVVNHNCSYLDSRISLLFLAAAVTLVALSFFKPGIARRVFRATLFILLAVGASLGYTVSRQQTEGMKIATAAWTRADAVACTKQKINAEDLGRYIDPNHWIPMQTNVNSDNFWRDYTNHIAHDGRCASQDPVYIPILTNRLQLNAAVPIHADSSGLGLLGTGWSHPEPNGVWTDGKTALLAVNIQPSSEPLKIVLQLQGFAPGDRKQQYVIASIEGAGAAEWHVSSSEAAKYEIALPNIVTIKGGQISVRLAISDPVSPLQAHLSVDARQLGVLLSSVELLPVNSPSAQ